MFVFKYVYLYFFYYNICLYSNVCSKLGASSSPSHALFLPNSTTKAGEFGNPSLISKSTSYYSNFIYQHLKFYPFNTTIIANLIPETTKKFFSTYKYPIFILYDSTCNEDSDFIAQWLTYATENHNSSGDYGFGKLDCSKYSDECNKWGATYPSATVFSRDKTVENGNYNYFFTTVFKGKDTNFVCNPVSSIDYAFQGGKRDVHDFYEFGESYEFSNMNAKKKPLKGRFHPLMMNLYLSKC